MTSSSPQCLLVATTALLLLSAATTQARINQDGDPLSANPCQKTGHPNLCQAILGSGHFQSDKELAVAAIRQTMDKVKSGIAAVERKKEAAGADKLRAEYLEACKTHYTDALNDLQTALDHLTGNGSELDVSINLSAALTDIDTCSSEWDESGMQSFPLDRINANLYDLASNTLSLGKGLKGTQS